MTGGDYVATQRSPDGQEHRRGPGALVRGGRGSPRARAARPPRRARDERPRRRLGVDVRARRRRARRRALQPVARRRGRGLLAARFDDYDTDPEVRAAVARLDVRWVVLGRGFLRAARGRRGSRAWRTSRASASCSWCTRTPISRSIASDRRADRRGDDRRSGRARGQVGCGSRSIRAGRRRSGGRSPRSGNAVARGRAARRGGQRRRPAPLLRRWSLAGHVQRAGELAGLRRRPVPYGWRPVRGSRAVLGESAARGREHPRTADMVFEPARLALRRPRLRRCRGRRVRRLREHTVARRGGGPTGRPRHRALVRSLLRLDLRRTGGPARHHHGALGHERRGRHPCRSAHIAVHSASAHGARRTHGRHRQDCLPPGADPLRVCLRPRAGRSRQPAPGRRHPRRPGDGGAVDPAGVGWSGAGRSGPPERRTRTTSHTPSSCPASGYLPSGGSGSPRMRWLAPARATTCGIPPIEPPPGLGPAARRLLLGNPALLARALGVAMQATLGQISPTCPRAAQWRRRRRSGRWGRPGHGRPSSPRN